MRNPLRRFQCEQRNRNCKSNTSVSDANRCRRRKKPRKVLHATLARTAHHDHFVRGEIAEPQPPIALFLLRFHENKIRTCADRVYPFVARRSGVTYPLPMAPLLAATRANLPKYVTSSAANFRRLTFQNPRPGVQNSLPHLPKSETCSRPSRVPSPSSLAMLASLHVFQAFATSGIHFAVGRARCGYSF